MLNRSLFRHRPPRPTELPPLLPTFPDADPQAVVAAIRPAGRTVAVADPSGWIAVALLLAGARVACVGPSWLWLWLAAAQRHLVEARQLWGLDAAGRRIWLYHRVRDTIPEPHRTQINLLEPSIRAGLLSTAPEDRFAPWIRAVHRPEAWIDADADRRRVLANRWRTLRFRVATQGLPTERVLATLARVPVRENPWAQRLLFGRWVTSEALPLGLQPESHRALAASADRVIAVPAEVRFDAAWQVPSLGAPICASIAGDGDAIDPEAAAANRRWDADITVRRAHAATTSNDTG
jgi:hypothetical protein